MAAAAAAAERGGGGVGVCLLPVREGCSNSTASREMALVANCCVDVDVVVVVVVVVCRGDVGSNPDQGRARTDCDSMVRSLSWRVSVFRVFCVIIIVCMYVQMYVCIYVFETCGSKPGALKTVSGTRDQTRTFW